jgi:hypothetical protein
MNRLHMLCDDTFCTHVLTLGISETMEEALNSDTWGTAAGGLAHDWMSDIPDTGATRAIHAAAAVLGWRRELINGERKTRCPSHSHGLVCARCRSWECSCVGGPGFDVVRP